MTHHRHSICAQVNAIEVIPLSIKYLRLNKVRYLVVRSLNLILKKKLRIGTLQCSFMWWLKKKKEQARRPLSYTQTFPNMKPPSYVHPPLSTRATHNCHTAPHILILPECISQVGQKSPRTFVHVIMHSPNGVKTH